MSQVWMGLGLIDLRLGNCLDVMKSLPSNSVHAVVTDPPYGLSFMGKAWDYQVPSVAIWREALRVLKPGGYLLAFSGTRTYHMMAIKIENAGFDICDMLSWLYGTGFPKSHDVSKGIDNWVGAERKVTGSRKAPDIRGGKLHAASGVEPHEIEITSAASPAAQKWEGWGSALKPACEPIAMCQKPLDDGLTIAENVLKYGCGAINVDASRIEAADQDVLDAAVKRMTGNTTQQPEDRQFLAGTKTIQPNSAQGRWPANVLFDEEAAAMLDEQSGIQKDGVAVGGKGKASSIYGTALDRSGGENQGYGSGGGASRFFLVVKRDPFDITASCGSEKIKADVMYAGKRTENKSECLNTAGYGPKPTDQYRLTTISIIETATSLIMTFPISNAFTKMCIGIITIVSEKTINLYSAESVESVSVVSDTEALISLSDGRRVPIKGIVSIALEPTLKNGMLTTESTTTLTCASTTASENSSRFFYVAKASKRERNAGLEGMPLGEPPASARGKPAEGRQTALGLPRANHHPTVKPVKLMEYLIRLVTPPGGIILDPFMGSGTTGVAALSLGFDFIGIEMSEEYFEIARRRTTRS